MLYSSTALLSLGLPSLARRCVEAVEATYFGANGWLLDWSGLRVLVDPWFRGPLVFPPGPWFFQGQLSQSLELPADLDLLLLTQGLDDHAHPETLALLPRSLPVVGSMAAAKKVQQLGFEQVTGLRPGEITVFGDLRIEATAGAPVPQVENGYLLRHPEASLYLEPHGYLSAEVAPEALDAVITPVVDLGLPVAGAFVRGQTVLPELVQRFSPRKVLASTTGGEVRFSGWLNQWLWQKGTLAEAQQAVGSAAQVIDPVPGQRYALGA